MLHEQMYGLSVGLIIINTKPCDFIDKISTKSQGCFFCAHAVNDGRDSSGPCG